MSNQKGLIRFAMCDKVKRRALERNQWEDVARLGERKDAATYRIQSFHREMDGLRYRFIAVQSSALDERKKKRLERLIETELRAFSKAATEESERNYSCLEDAERAAAKLTKGLKGYHTIEVSTHEEMEVLKRATRGDHVRTPLRQRVRSSATTSSSTTPVQRHWKKQDESPRCLCLSPTCLMNRA